MSKYILMCFLAAKQYDVPPMVIWCQFRLESSNGTSDLAKTHNNFFGHRRGNGQYIRFLASADSFAAHANLLSRKYRTDGTTKDWFKNIQKKGYAEDPFYANKLNQIYTCCRSIEYQFVSLERILK